MCEPSDSVKAAAWHQFCNGVGGCEHTWWKLGWYEFGYLHGMRIANPGLSDIVEFCMLWERRLVDLEGGERG